MDIDGAGAQALIRVDRVDPLVLVCAECGWTPARCGPADPTARLLWAVIDHWWQAHRERETAR